VAVSRRIALIAGILVALAAAPDALAAAPTLLTAGQTNGHATATWSLPAGELAQQVEVSLVTSTDTSGAFRFVETGATLTAAQTSWTDTAAIEPGTYYLHVGGTDSTCTTSCPTEWSAIKSFTVTAGGATSSSRRVLSVILDGTGTGTVTSNPSRIDCGDSCFQSFAIGAHVTLTPAAAPGSKFIGWQGGGCSGYAPTCEVIMNVSQTVTATFDLIAPPSIAILTGTRGATGATATFTVCDDSPGVLTIAVSQVWKESNGKWQGVTTTTSAQHAAGCDTQTVTVAVATTLSPAWIAVQVTDVDGRQGSLFTIPF
jgi:hypothetical protein